MLKRCVAGAAAGVLAASLLAADGMASDAVRQLLPVPKVTLYPGDPLLPSSISEKLFKVPAAATLTFAMRKEQLAGKVARRTLPAGRPIALRGIRNVEVVKQGRPVQAVYAEDGLIISAEVMPLQSGEPGQVVQARNMDSGRLLQGTVRADGTLAIEVPR